MLEDINVFCSIAKNQSFAKAARELGLSTPVVTRRLARLEATLDTRLLNRTTRAVTLTEAGNLFFRDISDLLQSLEATKETVKSLTNKITGTLKVGLPLSFSNLHVTKSLNTFLSNYPDLRLQVSTGPHQIHLLNEGYDLVIHCGPLPDSSFYYRKLGAMKKVICASPSYFERYSAPVHPEDLLKHNCLHLNETLQTWKFCIDNQAKEFLLPGKILINNFMDLRNLALDGVGLVCLPNYLVSNDLKEGRLVSVLEDFTKCDHPVYAVYPSNKFLSKKTELFISFIRDLIINVLTGFPSDIQTE